MKTATIPSVRVEPEFRSQVERLLGEGESLSEFVETAVRDAVRQRRDRTEFIARGLRSLVSAETSGIYLDSDEVLQNLEGKLLAAKARRSAAPS